MGLASGAGRTVVAGAFIQMKDSIVVPNEKKTLTRNEQTKIKEMKYACARELPQYSSPRAFTAGKSGSHLAPVLHANMMLCQFSPVADLKN